MNVLGAVAAVSKKGNSILIAGKWYSQFKEFKPMISKGDIVEFEFTENGEWNNIIGPVKIQKAPKDVTAKYETIKEEMTKADWEAKDQRYYKTQCLIAASGDLEKAKLLLSWVNE